MAVVPSTLPRQVFFYRFFSVSDTLYCLLYHENCASPPLSWEGIPLKNIINFFPFKSSPAFYPFFPDTSFLSLASSFASFPSSSLRRTTGYSPAHVRVHRFILALLLSSHSHLSYLSPSEIELDRGFNKSRTVFPRLGRNFFFEIAPRMIGCVDVVVLDDVSGAIFSKPWTNLLKRNRRHRCWLPTLVMDKYRWPAPYPLISRAKTYRLFPGITSH